MPRWLTQPVLKAPAIDAVFANASPDTGSCARTCPCLAPVGLTKDKGFDLSEVISRARQCEGYEPASISLLTDSS